MLDTTVLIDASTNDQFAQYLVQLVNNFEFLLYTIPSAQYEFTRMAKSAKARTQYDNLISELKIAIIGGLETKINDEAVKEFLLIYNNCINQQRGQKKAPSYTDSLLCLSLFLRSEKTEKLMLMSANHKDMPIEFFNREDVITIACGNNISNECIYSFNQEKYQHIVAKYQRHEQKK